jgi:diguanylate cyclase (GGDEF)-like protein/PAS domain S-box-containing protein
MSMAVRLFGGILIAAIIAAALFFVSALRSKDIEEWRRNLRGMSYMLSEHTAQTVFSARLVLDAICERVQVADIRDEADFRTRLASREMHALLREKIQGSPQLDVASLVASNGDNINFSRAYPVPPINLAERDYFKAHQTNARLGDYISTSVRNKGNGKWTFYLSRRISNAEGRFLGLVLVGLSVESITGVYDRVAQSLGEGAGITLFRTDLTALARAPRQDDVIGRISQSGPAHTLLAQDKQTEDVVLIDTPRFSTGMPELRLSAVHKVDRYPLVVAMIVPERIFLADWRRTALLIGALSLLGIAFVIAGITTLTRGIARREHSERELRDSETKFHTMVDWATDWEYWIREDGSIHYMTPSVETFTGHPVEAFVRDPGLIAVMIHPEDRPLWNSHTADVAVAPELRAGHAIDLRIVHRDGTERWVSHICRPVYGHDGTYLGRRATMRDITERKSSENEIRQLAYYDPLTGLPNRRLFLDRLGHALAGSERSLGCGALMMLDLDHFKKLNDTQGHDVGDRLLIEVARRLTQSVREADTVSRLGGDEFAVMIDVLDANETQAARQAEQVAEKIHIALNQPYTLGHGQPEHSSSPSIGVTLFRGTSVPIEVLMKQADVALYQAKDAGRNAIRFFNPAMQAAIDARISKELALRQALLQGQFLLHYQPQVDAHGQLIGAEALIRWACPVRGLLLPDTFIPLAEETGLIVEIGQWVLDMACAQLYRWQADPATRALQIAVNVSARQFHQPDFVDRVRLSLAASGANPHQLKLELTESMVVEHVEEVVERMQQLHQLGVSFSLDDFGTGYSSLSYLKRLPLDEIKIDRSFVRDLVDDGNDAAIVQAILAMSASLGLRVMAEGVETTAQRDFLRRHGCQGFQGYLYDRPAPISEWTPELVPA